MNMVRKSDRQFKSQKPDRQTVQIKNVASGLLLRSPVHKSKALTTEHGHEDCKSPVEEVLTPATLLYPKVRAKPKVPSTVASSSPEIVPSSPEMFDGEMFHLC